MHDPRMLSHIHLQPLRQLGCKLDRLQVAGELEGEGIYVGRRIVELDARFSDLAKQLVRHPANAR